MAEGNQTKQERFTEFSEYVHERLGARRGVDRQTDTQTHTDRQLDRQTAKTDLYPVKKLHVK